MATIIRLSNDALRQLLGERQNTLSDNFASQLVGHMANNAQGCARLGTSQTPVAFEGGGIEPLDDADDRFLAFWECYLMFQVRTSSGSYLLAWYACGGDIPEGALNWLCDYLKGDNNLILASMRSPDGDQVQREPRRKS